MRCLLRAAAAAAVLLASPIAEAQTKVTKLIVAFPPGGPVDIVARLLLEPMSKDLGHSVIVENKPGGNTMIGAEAAARSPADGSVVFFSSIGAVVLNPLLYDKLPYDVARDFAPVTLIVSSPTILVVHPSNPAKDAREFVSAGKAAAKPVPIASAGSGGTTHLALELFADATGMPTLHVPYKGAAPAITDLINNQVGAFFGDLPGLISHLQGGKLKALAVAAPKGHPLLPDVKTLADQGVGVVECVNWYGAFVPAKTPPETIAALNKAFHAALSNETIKERLISSGADIIPSTPAGLAKAVSDDTAKWGAIIKAKGIKAD